MLRILIPVLLFLVATGGGVGAGLFLRPAPDPQESAAPPPVKPPSDYVKLPNQFVVPYVENGRVQSLVIMSLSLEVPVGGTEATFAKEPKLRDGFLQVLYQHANAGGFQGNFTEAANLEPLRRALLEVAKSILADGVSDVLISELVRQDS